MISNPITGRSYIFTGYPPNKNEVANPDPSLTIATIIFCIVGPFWLFLELVDQVANKISMVSSQNTKVTE